MGYGDANYDPYAGYDPNGETIQSLTDKLVAQQMQISSIVSEVARSEESIEEFKSEINQTAYEITLSVQAIQTDYSGFKKDVSSQIQVLADSITSTVSYTEFNTKTGEIIADYTSKIQQVADSIEFGVITQNNLDDLESELRSDYEAKIKVNADAITSKVSQTQLDSTRTQLVSDYTSKINQTASSISSKVSYTDFTGTTIASLINQSADSITIAAKKINFDGAIISKGSIRANAEIDVATRIYAGDGLIIQPERSGGTTGMIMIGNHTMSADYTGEGGYSPLRSYGGITVDYGTLRALQGAIISNGLTVTGGLSVSGTISGTVSNASYATSAGRATNADRADVATTAGTANSATNATNADTLDGYHANQLALASHNHGNTYFKSTNGQDLGFFYSASTKKLGLYVNGAQVTGVTIL